MATKKKKADGEGLFPHLERKAAEIRALPLIATKYWVEEVTDGYDNSDDRYITGTSRTVSPTWDSRKYDDPRAMAEAWIDDHDPDTFVAGGARPNYFVIQKRYLRTHVENKWSYI